MLIIVSQSIPDFQRLYPLVSDFLRVKKMGDAMKSWGFLPIGAGHEDLYLGSSLLVFFWRFEGGWQ